MSKDVRLHYEDFPAGETVRFGAYEVTADEIKQFAAEFDPQPFHLDELSGEQSVAGALSASGWHTLSMLMRMMVDGYLARSASMGSFGVEEVKWLKPVFAGDVLSCTRTTLDTRISRKRPDMGIVRFHWQVHDQHGELKADMRGTSLLTVRECPA